MKFGKEKIKTAWSYYKWRFVAGILLLAVLLFLVVQCANREKADLYIYWAGPVYFTPGAQDEVADSFEAVIPKEYAKTVGMITTIIGKDPDVAQAEGEFQEAQNYVGKKETLQEFKYQMRLPDAVICILSPTCFDTASKDTGSLRPISDLAERYALNTTENGLGILLSDLPFYRSNPILKNFPANSVICVKAPSVFRSSDHYEKQLQAFEAILAFGAER